MKFMKNEAQPSQTLAKALQILETFSSEKSEWGIREMGREIGINPTTVFRIVNTLHFAGYLQRNPISQTYSLGPRIMKLANLYVNKNPLPVIARKVFEEYSDRFEHNFYLGQLNQYEAIYLAVFDGRGPIKVVMEPGGTTNLHSTGMGKALLAYQSPQYIHDYFDQAALAQLTKHTIVSKQELAHQLEQVRKVGYAINDGEQFEEIGAVGVPLLGGSGVVNYAIGLGYPQHLIQEKRLNLEFVISLAVEIAKEIVNRYDPTI